VPKRNHAIVIDESRCKGCVACVMACPTRALRVQKNLVQANRDRCIDCGACIGVCSHGALRARTSTSVDLERFKYKVALPSLVLYGQFGDDARPWQILNAFRSIGFDAACDISWMCEMVAAAIDAYLTDCGGPWPKIAITCPAVMRLIQLEYPSLLPHLVPINTPRELAAKMHRRRIASERGLDPSEIGLFYISPCTSLVDTIESPLGRRTSHLDGAFSIAEVYGPLLRAIKSCPGEEPVEEPVSIRGLRWVMANGEIPGMRNENSITVKGLRDVVFVLDRIESGTFVGADFINTYVCEDGCFSGHLTIAGRYEAQRYLHQVVRRLGDPPPVKESKIRSLLQSHFFDMDGDIEPVTPGIDVQDLRQVTARLQKRNELLPALPGKNCAACGAPNCETLAGDVVDGTADLTDCPFARIEQLTREIATLKGRRHEE
jgi:Na+-translocating ferredoxin:NAD+ oxidoreductase RNF subunit RnfB